MNARLLEVFGIESVGCANEPSRSAALRRIDTLTKPLGALGRLEALAAQVCAVQGTVEPSLAASTAIVFAGDHGIADRGVSAYPRSVTRQMVQNFLSGGAAISVLARGQGMPLWIVDAGVDGVCDPDPHLIDAKIRAGTRDFSVTDAMSDDECLAALRQGSAILDRVVTADTGVVVLGEMGIGNTSAAAVLMHHLTGVPLVDCVGRGTGLDEEGVMRKCVVLQQASTRRVVARDPVSQLTAYGGYEIAMLVGAMIRAASRRLLIVVDGFTVTIAAALAAQFDRNVLDFCIFGHCSAERAHRALLELLGVRPILDLGMRLGEGTGGALALPVIRAAVDLLNGMATFAGAGVCEKTS